MDFYEVLDQIIALLRQRGRVSYHALKRQFDVDDAYLEDLKVELIEVQELARDHDGKMLVWFGEAVRTPESTSASATPELVSPTVHAGPPIAHTPPYLAEKILTSRHALEGERKQVTVLFADLKGSMELLAERDPEEARQLLDPVLAHMMAAVHRYEGTVNQVMGDGIMALFGAPIAHEDHAVRACYAALAMQEAMQGYAEEVRRTQGLLVQMRVGLNSGEVVVRAIGNDLHMDYSAVGQTTHLAARMEQLAAPGSILLTAATLRLVEGLVRALALGPVPVKGLAEPVEVFELVGATALRRRLQAAVARGLTRFVGRQTELEALHQRLEQASTGHGQVVAAGGRGWRGQVAPGLRGAPLAPHAGLAGARECFGVLRQSHAVLPGTGPTQALCPRRGPRRHAHHPGQSDRAGADARRHPSRRPSRPCWRCWMSCRRTIRFSPSTRRSGAGARSTA